MGNVMNDLNLELASNPREHDFAQALTKKNMKALTKRHWGAWRSDVFSAHYASWDNYLKVQRTESIGYAGVEKNGDILKL